jgi:predicted GNAT family acetyltransferase
MDVVRFDDPRTFRARTGEFLLEDEARHTLLLSFAATLVERPEAYPDFRLWIVEEDGRLMMAAGYARGFGLAISRAATDDAIPALAEAIGADGVELAGVVAAVPEVEAFTDAWVGRGLHRARLAMDQRIYALRTVPAAAAVPGTLRDAQSSDRDLLVSWIRAFVVEALHEDAADVEGVVDARLAGTGSGLVLWEDGGRPVSMAGYGGRTPNGARIGSVYTPPPLRRRGYAGATVAALSRRLLAEGLRFCFLYTDLSNPTSNSIYMALGYEPVCDSREYRFESR